MSGELRLDLAGLRARAARLADIADRVQHTHAGLRDCLDRADGSWGDDHMGRAFAEDLLRHRWLGPGHDTVVLATAGTGSAVAELARAVLRPGDVVAIEDPGICGRSARSEPPECG